MTGNDDTARPSGWRTEKGRAEYLAAYDAALELWPVPFESRQVTTGFGSTHVIESGPPHGEPLLLLHAATGFGATQWYPNVAELSEQHRVYAVDFIGSAGKGTQTRPILDRTDCADWLADVLDGLRIDRCNIAGSSQGGWFALNIGLLNPERVNGIAALAPAAAIWPIRPLMRASIRLGPHMPAWLGPPSIKAMVGGRVEIDERIVRTLTLHLKHFRYQDRAVFPTVFADDELRGLSTRTLVMTAEHERIYDPRKALDRARRLIPNVETEFSEGVGHLINMENPGLTSDRLLRFFQQWGQSQVPG